MLQWKTEYSVKIDSIDGQHQDLFRAANELREAVVAGTGKAALAKMLDRLIEDTTAHFADEERLMADNGYPDFASHKAEHDKLTKQVLQFRRDFGEGRIGVTFLMVLLGQWLANHIVDADQACGSYLRDKGIA